MFPSFFRESNNILYRGIYTVVTANHRHVTENETVKILRGQVLPNDHEYKATEFGGKFACLHEDVVKSAVEYLITNGIIQTQKVSGRYINYYELFPDNDSSYLFEYVYAPCTAETEAEHYTDDDWLEVIRQEAPPADQADQWMNFTYLLDHHGLVCFAMDEVAAFLAKGPETILTYIEARKEIASTLVERKMYKTLLDKIREAATKALDI